MSLVLVTPPSSEPVNILEARQHLRVEHALDDSLIEGYIAAARQEAELRTGRQLMKARWELQLERFPAGRCPLLLPLPPLQAVVSIEYLDGDQVLQTWDPGLYEVDKPTGETAEFGTVCPAYGECYPAALCTRNAVRIRFDAGYGGGGQPAVPAGIKNAILIRTGGLYEHRENVVTGTIVAQLDAAKALLQPFTMRRFPAP